MSLHEDELRLIHMLEHAKEAVAMASGRSRSGLESDRMLNLALVRLLEITGEAASRVTAERQAMHPDIPWSQIVSLRNRLIHGYESVDFNILWQIIVEDLPPARGGP